MESHVKVLLMTGGSGTRLWPKSRASMPKQFMSLGPGQTLFQRTLQRVKLLVPAASIYAVTPPEYLPHIQSQAPDMPASRLIVEPFRQSTTACLAYAMAWLQEGGLKADDVIVVLPTDAYVGDDQQYMVSLRHAIEMAKSTTGIVTIGIQPNYPATGYGYIQCDTQLETHGQLSGGESSSLALRVRRFVEKPEYEQAKTYLEEGNFFWNAGMFIWKASTVMNLFSTLLPNEHELLQDMVATLAGSRLEAELSYEQIHQTSEWDAIQKTYRQFPKQSFEFSIVEKAPEIYMVPGQFDWTDLGTWSVLLDKLGSEATEQDVVVMDSEGCLVENQQGLVGLLGVKDLIVVHTGDTVFICHRDRDQDVKKFRELLKGRGYEDYL